MAARLRKVIHHRTMARPHHSKDTATLQPTTGSRLLHNSMDTTKAPHRHSSSAIMAHLKDSLSNNLDLACLLSTAINGRMATTKLLRHRLRLHNRSAPAHPVATLSSTQHAMDDEKRF